MARANNGWKQKRKTNRFVEKENFYIFTEGTETEPNYFDSFKKIIEKNPIYRNMVHINIEPCGEGTTRILKRSRTFLKQNRIDSGSVWIVYDKDLFSNESFDQVVLEARQSNESDSNIKYHAIWSNESFELWFVLHFENTSATYRKQYNEFLTKKLKSLNLGKYEKNSKDMFCILLKYGDPKKANRFAKRMIENEKDLEFISPHKIVPGTKVYELVEALAQYFPEEIKEKFI